MNDLPTCPACGAPHLPVATRCPKCGEPFRQDQLEKPPYEPKRRIRLAVIGAVVVAGAAGLWAVAPNTRPASPPEPAAPTFAPTPEPAPARDSIPVITPAIEAVPAREAAPPPERPAAAASPTELRWTVNWANVREAPSLEARVVAVVRPGDSVAVGERRGGFRRIYRDGTAVGWVAVSLLLSQPPPEIP